MFDSMSDRPWHAVCVVNDEVSQTTVSLLGHIEQRMTQVANGRTPDVAFGGHAVTLVDRYILLADDEAGTAKQRNHWRECYENDTPMARGVDTTVKLGAQMRSQSDAQHYIHMIRNFHDISSDIPCPLTPYYLQTILQYSKDDAKADST